MNNFVHVTWDDGFYREFHFRDAASANLFACKLQQATGTTTVVLKVAGQSWQKLK